MAVFESPLGQLRGSIGHVTFRKRLGQNVATTKPRPQVLKGVKNMTDEELRELAERTGYSFEDLVKIRAKQQKMGPAINACREEKKNPDFKEKYKPRKPGETSFNACVAQKLKEA